MEALVAALAERFAARKIPLQADPKRSPFRIYRDTRFSKDKAPYKTHVAASFPWIEATTAAPTGGGAAGGAPAARVDDSPACRRSAGWGQRPRLRVGAWVETSGCGHKGPGFALRITAANALITHADDTAA
jgi:Conserved hypothetical protein (DUF2461)